MPSRHRGGANHHGVRTINSVYSDMGHHEEGIRPESVLLFTELNKEMERLEKLTTAQLRDIAEREHAPVAPVFGKGQRKRFIDAIARKRTGF